MNKLLLSLPLLFLLQGCITHYADSPPDEALLFTYFTGNGEDGLHLAYSVDGLRWEPLNNNHSYLAPEVGTKLMRDPSITQGADGMFHMVWTTGWWDTGIGVAHSKDLIHWSEQAWVKVMDHEADAMNCWAPEIFYDAATDEYVIVWSTTIPGRFPETASSGDDGKNKIKCNHRMYYVTTKDFKTYSDTKLFYDDGFNVIDGFIAKDGDRYMLVLKDETRYPEPKKNLRLAFAEKATGPYSGASDPFTPDWVEGPTAMKKDGYWYVYYDEYTRNRYGARRSKDLATWEDLTDQIHFPGKARHGTVFKVSGAVLAKLLAE